MKAVVDTNVLISAIMGREGGASRAVLRACLGGVIQPLMSTALFLEMEDVASRPRVRKLSPLSEEEIQDFLDAHCSVSTWIQIYYRWRPALRDAGDHHLLELAVAGNADAIITKNVKDFRDAELSFPRIRIAPPDEIAQEL